MENNDKYGKQATNIEPQVYYKTRVYVAFMLCRQYNGNLGKICNRIFYVVNKTTIREQCVIVNYKNITRELPITSR